MEPGARGRAAWPVKPASASEPLPLPRPRLVKLKRSLADSRTTSLRVGR